MWTNLTLAGSETGMMLRNLKPITNYQLRIFAVNALGQGEPSNNLYFKTDEEAPSGPPTHFKVIPTSSRSLKVSWKAPRKELQNGAITGYYIGYRLRPNILATTSTSVPDETNSEFQYKTINVKESDHGELEYLLRNLQRSTQYGLIVQAINSKGASPATDEILIKTHSNGLFVCFLFTYLLTLILN